MTPSAKRLVIVASAFVLAFVASHTANALPQFARKYKLDCSGCHDALAFPRLNDIGYKFRRSGFRMPENIGKEELADYTLDNYFSAAIRADNTTTRTRAADSTDRLNTFSGELSLYALTGSFEKYFASETELGIAPGGGLEVENAYVRAVWGNQDLWLTSRAGVFHAIEGLGGSDRSLGPSRPLIFEVAPNDNQDTLLRIPEVDRIGVDVGVQWHASSFSVEIVNRARPEISEDGVSASAASADARSGKDLIVVVNQILGARSGLSAYWAHGAITLPVNPAMPAVFAAGTSADTFDDRYDKVAVFASGGTGTLLGLVGAQLGLDHALDPVSETKSRFSSIGGFVEGNLAISAHCVAYLRLDVFDPSTKASGDQILGGALGVLAYQSAVSIVPELTLRRTNDESAAGLVVRARVIY